MDGLTAHFVSSRWSQQSVKTIRFLQNNRIELNIPTLNRLIMSLLPEPRPLVMGRAINYDVRKEQFEDSMFKFFGSITWHTPTFVLSASPPHLLSPEPKCGTLPFSYNPSASKARVIGDLLVKLLSLSICRDPGQEQALSTIKNNNNSGFL